MRQNPEAQLAKQVCDYLALDGWRAVKMEPLSGRGVARRIIAAIEKLDIPWAIKKLVVEAIHKATQNRGGGEPGMPDYLFLRNGKPCKDHYPRTDLSCSPANCEHLWLEVKAPDGRVTEKQKQWHLAERARGALVVVAKEDFEPTLAGFARWYEQSGLQRRTMRVGAA